MKAGISGQILADDPLLLQESVRYVVVDATVSFRSTLLPARIS